MRSEARCLIAALLLAALPALAQTGVKAGAARRDITPREPVPMWGYGARHDALSTGVLDSLHADALVVEAGGRKVAFVSLDLGRSPNERSLQAIRKRILAESGVEYSFIAGSHTHHGPVLELSDEPGKGKGKFDAALRYYAQLEDAIVDAVDEANRKLAPARLGSASVQLAGFNRNRHSKLPNPPSDRELAVLRIDGADGEALATLVNFAAHPTMLPAESLKFSADYVGALKSFVASETHGAALFFQGAAGDQSVNRDGRSEPSDFGQALAREALKLRAAATPEDLTKPAVVREDRFQFTSRINFNSPFVKAAFSAAFFPELIPNYIDEYKEGVRPRLTVAMLGDELGFVGVSGEFFSNHSVRLKDRARVKHLFLLGYCNGYHQYFPTIEAVSEGGYGADSQVSPVEVGAGEAMMNKALLWTYQLRGKIK